MDCILRDSTIAFIDVEHCSGIPPSKVIHLVYDGLLGNHPQDDQTFTISVHISGLSHIDLASL